jgi:hypothetical protein
MLYAYEFFFAFTPYAHLDGYHIKALILLVKANALQILTDKA